MSIYITLNVGVHNLKCRCTQPQMSIYITLSVGLHNLKCFAIAVLKNNILYTIYRHAFNKSTYKISFSQ